jgi:hypothetical protein
MSTLERSMQPTYRTARIVVRIGEPQYIFGAGR